MGLDVIDTDPQYLKTLLLKALVVIPQVAGFGSTAGGVILWVEVQDYFPAAVFRKANRLAILIRGLKARG
jgi:hypothetical protein